MERVCNYERTNVERIAARILVIALALFWLITAFSGLVPGIANTPLASLGAMIVPLAVLVAAFVVGLYYEQPAAWILFAGAAASIIWGFVAGWEAGVWGMMITLLTAPLVVAGFLYLLANRNQMVCSLQEGTGGTPGRPAAGAV